MIRHIKRWNIWRKRTLAGPLHRLGVLFGIQVSVDFECTLLPDEATRFDRFFKNKEDK